MPSKGIYTEVDGQKLKLTNLHKILYPNINVTKAQFIQYYIDIAPHIMKYIELRPLTLIRYPDGIKGKKFYSKSKPKWTPDWVKSYPIHHDSKDIDYLYLHNKASLVWMANLASLEIHPTQFKVTNNYKPDHFIFDLDPDVEMPFDEIKASAFDIRDFLEEKGYTSFIKTSGSKGVHLYIPILPNWPYEKVTFAIKELAKEFIQTNINKYTLHVLKSKRGGKILIDIYRNHLGNTCVAPYSTRGKPGAPLSMPITWNDLKDVKSSQDFNIINYKEYLKKNGDAWKDWREYETSIHTERKAIKKPRERTNIETTNTQNTNLPLDPRMIKYLGKRDFDKTTEPSESTRKLNRTDEFVVQLHDANNLHYDLRLEHQGTLWSWAIPKGLPTRKGVKRLAIKTEDHPVKYLDFEGEIPEGSYGGGTMWIMAAGKVIWHSKKANKSLKFSLSSNLISGEYKLYKLKENQWLVEMISSGGDAKKIYKPMLAEASKQIPVEGYSYEVKWDGIRALLYFDNDKVTIYSRSGRDITEQFPEFQKPNVFEVEYGVFDAEIVVLDAEGKPQFHNVISRMHSKVGIKAKSLKPATMYIFDVLNVDGIDITNFIFQKRREVLEATIKKGKSIRLSDLFNDGQLLFDAIQAKKMEGIMAKNLDAKYFDGQRSKNWLKIKCRTDDTAFIIGYTLGKGDRAKVFGALHLAKREKNAFKYMGKVGTGFKMDELKELFAVISKIPVTQKLISETIDEPEKTVWIEDQLKCKISYASMSSNNTYREPVFKKLVNDK
ncbi:MAG: non-homologous end-joining DNA ligase [Saprospiraceae bacterium]